MTAPPELTDPPSISQAAPAGKVWRRALPWLAAYAALQVFLRMFHLPAATPGAVVMLAGALVSLAVIFIAGAALFAFVARPISGTAVVSLLLVGGVLFGVAWKLTPLVDGGKITLLGPLQVWLTIGDIGLVCLGAGIGAGVAQLIRDRNILLPAGVFAAFADFFMVRFGTVHHAMQSEKGMRLISQMSAHVPAIHRSLPAATMGMADFVFLAFFFACAGRFEMNARATFWVLATLLSVLLFSIPWLGAFPAVLPMALGFVLVNLRYFKLTRAEIHATLIVFCMMAVLVTLFFVFVK